MVVLASSRRKRWNLRSCGLHAPAHLAPNALPLPEPGDPRRDSGFTLFYAGINLGALFASIVCGYLGQTLGWRFGFGAAGIGMLLGLAQFLWG